jgi:hypothetical protein
MGKDKIIKKLENQVQELEKELKKYKVQTPLYKLVFDQKEWYNGHGQLVLSEITITEIQKLLNDMTENYDKLEDIFHLKLYTEENGAWSGSIYNDEGGKEKMWVSFEKIIIDTKD